MIVQSPVIDIRGMRHFESEVLASEVPVAVDFWGPACGPCKVMEPVFRASAEAFRGQAKFARVNTQANSRIARSYNIRGVPTLVIFYGGEVFDVRVGAMPAGQLDAMVRRATDRHQGVGFLDRIKRIWSRSG